MIAFEPNNIIEHERLESTRCTASCSLPKKREGTKLLSLGALSATVTTTTVWQGVNNCV